MGKLSKFLAEIATMGDDACDDIVLAVLECKVALATGKAAPGAGNEEGSQPRNAYNVFTKYMRMDLRLAAAAWRLVPEVEKEGFKTMYSTRPSGPSDLMAHLQELGLHKQLIDGMTDILNSSTKLAAAEARPAEAVNGGLVDELIKGVAKVAIA